MHSVWHASLRTYQFVGGNEVFKQYFQTNQASGNGPGPAALGAHGLADAWTYTKADDDYEVTYWLYGDSEYCCVHVIAAYTWKAHSSTVMPQFRSARAS